MYSRKTKKSRWTHKRIMSSLKSLTAWDSILVHIFPDIYMHIFKIRIKLTYCFATFKKIIHQKCSPRFLKLWAVIVLNDHIASHYMAASWYILSALYYWTTVFSLQISSLLLNYVAVNSLLYTFFCTCFLGKLPKRRISGLNMTIFKALNRHLPWSFLKSFCFAFLGQSTMLGCFQTFSQAISLPRQMTSR